VSVSWPEQNQDDKYFVGAPMIAVEILSPGGDIERKLTNALCRVQPKTGSGPSRTAATLRRLEGAAAQIFGDI